MNNLFLLSFVSFFTFQNAQAMDSHCIKEQPCPTNKRMINPSSNLFEKEEQFPISKDNSGVRLKVNFSEPIYEKLPVINFDTSSNSDQTPEYFTVLIKNSTFFDIISNGTCVGEVKTDIMPNAPRDIYIRNIEVNKEYRGNGIGTKAISLVMEFYLQKQFIIQHFSAQIKPNNDASIRVFTKNKFLKSRELCLGLFGYTRKVED